MLIKIKPLETKEAESVILEHNQNIELAIRDYDIAKLNREPMTFFDVNEDYVRLMPTLSPSEINQVRDGMDDSRFAGFFLTCLVQKSYDTNPNLEYIMKSTPDSFGRGLKGRKEKPIILKIDGDADMHNFSGAENIICHILGNAAYGCFDNAKNIVAVLEENLSGGVNNLIDSLVVAYGDVARGFGNSSQNSRFIFHSALKDIGMRSIDCIYEGKEARGSIGARAKSCYFIIDKVTGYTDNDGSNVFYVDEMDLQVKSDARWILKTRNKKLFTQYRRLGHKNLYLLDKSDQVIKCIR